MASEMSGWPRRADGPPLPFTSANQGRERIKFRPLHPSYIVPCNSHPRHPHLVFYALNRCTLVLLCPGPQQIGIASLGHCCIWLYPFVVDLILVLLFSSLTAASITARWPDPQHTAWTHRPRRVSVVPNF